jgi:hypothetical protein
LTQKEREGGRKKGGEGGREDEREIKRMPLCNLCTEGINQASQQDEVDYAWEGLLIQENRPGDCPLHWTTIQDYLPRLSVFTVFMHSCPSHPRMCHGISKILGIPQTCCL